MQVMCCLFVMAILSLEVPVTSKLWKMESKEVNQSYQRPRRGPEYRQDLRDQFDQVDQCDLHKNVPREKEAVVPKKEAVMEAVVPKKEAVMHTSVPMKEEVMHTSVPMKEEVMYMARMKSVSFNLCPFHDKVKQKPVSCPKPTSYDATVLKQFIAKFLDQFQPLMVPGSSDEKIKYNMKMKLSSLDLSKISLYMNKDGDIYEVEEVLTSMLGDVSYDEMLLSNLPMTFYEKYLSHVIIMALIFLILFLVLSLRFMHLSFWILTKWITFQVLVVSIIWNWYFLYQENLTKYTTAIEKGPPQKCKENYKAGFLESFTSSFSEFFHVPIDDCEKYHLITSIPPALRVPPTEAISFCIVNTLLKPLASFGENIGLFFQKLSQPIPFHLQILAVVCLLIILLFVILIYNGYSIASFFLTLKPSPSPELKDSKEIKEKLEKIIEALEKVPSVDDVKEIREVLLKNVKQALENKPELNRIANPAGSGDGHEDQA